MKNVMIREEFNIGHSCELKTYQVIETVEV